MINSSNVRDKKIITMKIKTRMIIWTMKMKKTSNIS